MLVYIFQIIVTSLILLLMAKMVKGVQIDNWGSALFAAVILGLVNAFVRPLMVWLTIPLTVITMGLFLLVINALVLQMVAALVTRGAYLGIRPGSSRQYRTDCIEPPGDVVIGCRLGKSIRECGSCRRHEALP